MPSHSKKITHHLKIAAIELVDGQTLELKDDAIIVVTGSNNAGKSTFLGEIVNLFRRYGRQSYRPKIIKSLSKRTIGPSETVFDYLASRFELDRDDQDTLKISYSQKYRRKPVEEKWASGQPHEAIEQEFLNEIGLDTRLGRISGRDDDAVSQAADEMFYDERTELAISRIFKRAFGRDIILQRDRKTGIFKIGSRTKIPKHKDRLTPDFRRQLDAMEDVFSQGTGIRSFARMAIQLLTSWRSVIVIDEPELFLHPPQAKQLARLIAADVDPDRQIIIATHNETFLRNILDFGHERVVVLRLDRQRSITHVKILDNETIKNFWNDPLLRTSNIISALFHDSVVICEGESDVRFFETMMDSLYGQENLPDTAFFSCNGKGKIPSILEAVSAAKIPTVVITDFDVLRSARDTLVIYSLLGGNPDDLRADLELFHREVETDVYAPKLKTVRSKILEALDSLADDQPVPAAKITLLRSIVDHGSPWASMKLSGISAIKSQKGYQAAKRLVDKCQEVGFLINDFGELESLCRDVSSQSKSGWLHEVMQKDFKNDPSLNNAREMAYVLKARLPKVRT